MRVAPLHCCLVLLRRACLPPLPDLVRAAADHLVHAPEFPGGPVASFSTQGVQASCGWTIVYARIKQNEIGPRAEDRFDVRTDAAA